MYADDLVLIFPSTYGLKKLLEVCENYGIEFDVKFNSKKSAIMFFRPDYMQNSNLPVFKMNEENIEVVKNIHILGIYYVIHCLMT